MAILTPGIIRGLPLTALADKKITVKSPLTHIKDVGSPKMVEHMGDLLYNYASPQPVQATVCVISSMLSIAVGREAIVTDRAAHVPYTHAAGLTEQPALVTRMSFDLDKNKIGVTYRVGDRAEYGIAPSVRVSTSSKSGAPNYRVTCTIPIDYRYRFNPFGWPY